MYSNAANIFNISTFVEINWENLVAICHTASYKAIKTAVFMNEFSGKPEACSICIYTV